MMLKCRRCGQPHSGTMMRTDKRYTRVRDMINNEVPKEEDGRLKFCHMCQRMVYFAGSVNKMLIRDLKWAASERLVGDLNAKLFAAARRELGLEA
jgi:hypothetical protein